MPKINETRKNHHKVDGNSLKMVSAGSQFTAMILAGLLVGYFFDNFFDSNPLFMIGFALMGMIGGFMKLHRMLT